MNRFVSMSRDQQAAVIESGGRRVRLMAAPRTNRIHPCEGCFGFGLDDHLCIPSSAPCGRHSRADRRDIIWKETPQ